MKLPSLIHQVLRKTTPSTALEQDEINQKCQLWYEKKMQDIKIKLDSDAPLTIIDKVFVHMDEWYGGLLFSVAYFWVVKMIQDLMNPGSDPDEDEHFHDPKFRG